MRIERKIGFYNCRVGGLIDTRFIPSILKGMKEVIEEGPVTGSNTRDTLVMVYGKIHAIDSNDFSFNVAVGHAFKEASLNARPKLMVPIKN